jgi:sugar phosphate isomerase/epimerase
MRQELGINLLVYKEKLDQGIKQSALLKEIKKQGISLAEVRREYIKDQKELEDIAKTAKENEIKLYYSVPEKIIEEKLPNKNLRNYLEEAMIMKIQNVKFNIGSLDQIDQKGAEKLKEILEDYDLTYTIENDQTKENGTFACTKKTLEQIYKYELPVGYTMDLGNWYWQKEDPNTTFEELKNQISIFHLKNIDFKDGKLETVMLEDGKIEWMDMIGQLDDDVKVFLEYPIMEDEIVNQINTVKKAK